MSTINRYKKATIINNLYHSLVFYPAIPDYPDDIWITSRDMDRLDLISNRYYKDSTLWWIIAKANCLPGDSIFIESGKRLRIPNLSNIEKLFK